MNDLSLNFFTFNSQFLNVVGMFDSRNIRKKNPPIPLDTTRNKNSFVVTSSWVVKDKNELAVKT